MKLKLQNTRLKKKFFKLKLKTKYKINKK